MKTLCRFAFFLPLLLFCFPAPSLATHQVGYELTWRCSPTSSCLYTFTYTFYRDCPLTSVTNNPPALDFDCVGGGSSPSIFSNWTQVGNAVDITPTCPGQQSDCNGGSVPGVLAITYDITYDFCTGSPPCTEFLIGGNTCCRSNLITSLAGPTGQGTEVQATFTWDPTSCNNSPTFNSDPVVYLCNGQTSTFSNGATDADGDEHRYTLVPCRSNANSQVIYDQGFGPDTPLGPTWDVDLDHQSGEITFTPTGAGDIEVGVMCVRVDEFRNGVLVGSVVRDVEIRVLDCHNDLPSLSGANGNPSYTIDMCVGKKTCFTVNSMDSDQGDILSVSVVRNNTGATITMGPPPRPVTTICWTPTANDEGSHTIVLEVRDDACPITGVQQFTYTINVRHCDPCDTLDQVVSWNFSTDRLKLTVNNTTTGSHIDMTEYIWGDGSSSQMYPGNHSGPVQHTFPGPGTYTVCVKTHTFVGNVCCHDSVCKDITVYEHPCDEHKAEWHAVCLVSPPCTYTFFDATQPASSTVYWDFGAGGPLVPGSPVTYTFPGNGIYTITMYSTWHPNGDTSICCYDTTSYTWNIWCGPGIDPYAGIESTLKTSALAWNAQSSTLEVQLAEDLINEEPTTVQIYDMKGKLLQTRSASSTPFIHFDFSGVASGVFLIRMSNGEKVEVRKFAKP